MHTPGPFPSSLPPLRALVAAGFLALAAASAQAAAPDASAAVEGEAMPRLRAETRLPTIPMAAEARTAGIADGVTTGLALLAGGVEANPVGPLVAIALKPVMMKYVQTLPQEKQADYFSAFTAIWSGAAANNICVAVSLLSAGGFAPACVAVGVAWGAKKWNDTEPERVFWKTDCPRLREAAGNPGLACVYTARPPSTPSVSTALAGSVP